MEKQLEMRGLITRQSPWPIRFEEWQRIARETHERADRVSRMLTERARKACADAGLDPNLLGIHPHNAMCSYDAGKPWPNVNYSLVRKCQWLIRRSWEPGRIADRIVSRAWARLIPSADDSGDAHRVSCGHCGGQTNYVGETCEIHRPKIA